MRGESIATFKQLGSGPKIVIVLATVALAAASLCGAGFLTLLALFGRSIHGPAPPVIVLALPLLAAAIVGWATFVFGCRLLARRQIVDDPQER